VCLGMNSHVQHNARRLHARGIILTFERRRSSGIEFPNSDVEWPIRMAVVEKREDPLRGG